MGGIHWIAQLSIAEGELDEFTTRAEETIATVKAKEPHALVYEWNISDDGRLCHISAGYADAEAALAHVRGEAVATKLPRLLEVSELTGIVVYTAVDDPELREALSAFGATFTHHWGGFTR